MKSLLILLSVVALSQAVDKEFIMKFMNEVKKVGQQCIPETGASAEDIVSLMNHQVPNTHEGHCLLFCFHKHFHMQNEDGSVNKDGFLQAMEPLKANDENLYNKFLQIFDKCTASVAVNSDSCDYAGDLATCGITEGKAMGIHEDLMLE